MKTVRSLFAALVLTLAFGSPALRAQEGSLAPIAEKVAESAQVGALGITGHDPLWYYPPNELKHIAKGDYWTKWAALKAVDPVPIIAKYAAEVKALGADLILVPVPAKSNLYPEKLSSPAGAPISSLPFFNQISHEGVTVLDLEKLLGDAKKAGTKVYCEQDSHWSPEACQIVAKAIAESYRGADWIGDPKKYIAGAPEPLEVHGDLLDDAARKTVAKEKLTISPVHPAGAQKHEPLVKDPDSPILLIGDSHTLVFSEGPATGMHCFNAGLFDHLAAEFGIIPDRHANKGSGAHIARIDVARRAKKDPEMWKKKKLVIWVFSVREFTEGTWSNKIPAQP